MSVTLFLIFDFLLIVLYFTIQKQWQWVLLLAMNIIFYSYFGGVKAAFYILFIAFITFFAAIKIQNIGTMGKELLSVVNEEREKRLVRQNIFAINKLLCTLAIILGMGIWFILKYSDFLINNLNGILELFCINRQINSVSMILPLGMSFYTFHAIGYLLDVYRNKYPAERKFLHYLTFITYFAHIVQGPFSRYDRLGKDIFQKHSFSYERMCKGCSRILWGIVKKVVIADKIGPVVTDIFTNYLDYSGAHIIFAMFCYSIQLYADFSGYMDIVCGISRILGINLAENFRQPYFAKTIDEFWRRWHITLGTWFKDYMFYPISMGKTAQKIGKWARKTRGGAKAGRVLPGYFALFFVWTATGLWHGAGWGYLIWGYLNLCAMLSAKHFEHVYAEIKKRLHINNNAFLWQTFCMVRTFLVVCFFRLFTMTDKLENVFSIMRFAVLEVHLEILKFPGNLFIGMRSSEKYVFILGVALMLMIDVLAEVEQWENLKEKCPMLLRNLIYTGLIFSIILFGGGSNDLVGGFMYANF